MVEGGLVADVIAVDRERGPGAWAGSTADGRALRRAPAPDGGARSWRGTPQGRERSAVCRSCTWCSRWRVVLTREGLREVGRAPRPARPRRSRRSPPSTRCSGSARPGRTWSRSARTCPARSGARTRCLEAAHEAARGRARRGDLATTARSPLHEEECLGACDAAPVVQVDFANHDRVTPERIVELSRRSAPARSRRPRAVRRPEDFREASRILAGLEETARSAVSDGRPAIAHRQLGRPETWSASTGTSQTGGYEGLRARPSQMTPAEVIDVVKASGPPRPRRRRVPDGRQVVVRARRTRASRPTSSRTSTSPSPARSTTAS